MKELRLIVVILSLLAISFGSKAQYQISFEIKNSKDDTLLLCYYYLNQTYIWDTAFNKNNKFVFKNDKRALEDGIYFITNTLKNRMCEFIVMGDNKLDFTTHDDNWTENLQVKKNEKEKIYLDYAKQSNELNKQLTELIKQKNAMNKGAFENKYNSLARKNDTIKEEFIKKNPNHLLSKILLSSRPLKWPSFDTIYFSDGKVDSMAMKKEAFIWYKQHYFDNIDLTCRGILRTPKEVFYNHYNDFWEKVMKYEPCDSILYYIDFYLNKAKAADNVYQFMIYDLTKRYLTDNIMGHDKIYVEMVDKYFKTGKQTTMHPSDVEMNIVRADKWRKLLIGQTVPDLACPEDTNQNATWHHLDEFHTKYKLLIFWSIECSHCTSEIPQIAKFYNENKEKYDFEVMGIHTEGDINQMKSFVKEHDVRWVNCNGLMANYDWREYFDVEKTPIIYVLDSNDKILAKNISAANLEQVLKILDNGGFNL